MLNRPERDIWFKGRDPQQEVARERETVRETARETVLDGGGGRERTPVAASAPSSAIVSETHYG